MIRRSLIVGVFIVPLLLVGTAHGKSIEDLIKEMSENLIKTYTSPLVTAIGTAMNSGLYHTGGAHKTFGFDFGNKFMWVPIPAKDKTAKYSVLTLTVDTSIGNIDTSFTEVESSTIFGDKQGATLTPPPNTHYIPEELPGGIDIPGIPLIVPQLSIGIFKGSELMIRFISVGVEEINISLLGLGLKQNLNALPFMIKLPVDLGAQFVYQSFKLGDIVTCDNRNFNFHVSKDLAIPTICITPYFGIGIENTEMRFAYQFAYTDPISGTLKTEEVALSLSGENRFRTVVGLRFKFTILNINADYNIGKYPSLSVGAGISIR